MSVAGVWARPGQGTRGRGSAHRHRPLPPPTNEGERRAVGRDGAMPCLANRRRRGSGGDAQRGARTRLRGVGWGRGDGVGRWMGGWEGTGCLWREWGWWASCPECHGPSRWDPTQKEVELVPRKPRRASAASASLHSSGRSVDGSLRAGPRCHREESDTAFLACAYRVVGGGRKSYRCLENVTFTAESARRCGQASGRGRKERICQVFPSFTQIVRQLCTLSLYPA